MKLRISLAQMYEMCVSHSYAVDRFDHTIEFSWKPIAIVSTILIITNCLGYIVSINLESSSSNGKSLNLVIDACYGISIMLVAMPTLVQSGTTLRIRASSIFLFTWACLYMMVVYQGVYSCSPSTLSEIDWMQSVILCFIWLIPHSFGLTRLTPGNINYLYVGSATSFCGILEIAHSLKNRNLQSSDNSFESDELIFTSLHSIHFITCCGSGLIWMGIFLLNVPAIIDLKCRWLSIDVSFQQQFWSLLRFISAIFILCSSGFLLIPNTQLHQKLTTVPNQLSLTIHYLLQKVNIEPEFSDQPLSGVNNFDAISCTFEPRHLNFYYMQMQRQCLVDNFQTFPNSINTKRFIQGATSDVLVSTSEYSLVPEVSAIYINQSIGSLNEFNLSVQPATEGENGVISGGYEYFSLFKLKITNDLLYGAWV